MLTAQLPALIGVLVGAIATFGATFVTDRARWQREQSARWDVRRADVYAEYGFALKNVLYIATRMAAAERPEISASMLNDPLPREEGLGLLGDAERDRGVKWESVLLLGSEEVVEAGRRWHQSVFSLQAIARGTSNADWTSAVAEVSRERGRFYEAARRDLGLGRGSASRIYEWKMNEYGQSAEGRIREPGHDAENESVSG